MNRRHILNLSAVTALGLAVLPTGAISQAKSIKDQLVGTWTLVSETDTTSDGFNGTDGKRVITSLTADELRFNNPATSGGTAADTVWRRAK
jgi:hypothetical protein